MLSANSGHDSWTSSMIKSFSANLFCYSVICSWVLKIAKFCMCSVSSQLPCVLFVLKFYGVLLCSMHFHTHHFVMLLYWDDNQINWALFCCSCVFPTIKLEFVLLSPLLNVWVSSVCVLFFWFWCFYSIFTCCKKVYVPG